MTLLLGRRDLEDLLDVGECLTALRSGFTRPDPDVEAQRVRTDLPGPGTATALIPGLLDDVPAYTVKVNAKFPGSVPALRGVVCLHDLGTGELLAVLDSATITAWRTGLAAALGTAVLAGLLDDRRTADVGIVGAGAQARLVLRGLRHLARIDRVLAYDVDPSRIGGLDPAADPAADALEVAACTDIVVLATWSRTPILSTEQLRPGMHLTSLGADEPGKAELTASLLSAARVFVDDVRLASGSGALGNVGLGPQDAAGTLADVLREVAPGRRSGSEITVYAPIGLPWQDLCLSWLAYRSAQRSGAGAHFDWLS